MLIRLIFLVKTQIQISLLDFFWSNHKLKSISFPFFQKKSDSDPTNSPIDSDRKCLAVALLK